MDKVVKKHKALLMLVDDDAPSRMILKQIFAGKHDIVEAVNGKFALELINRGVKPDLVILDLNMPEIDGYEVLDELHQSDEFKHIPIIVATADSDYAAKRKAFFLGAIDVITKPFMPESITYRVDNILASISATRSITESIILNELFSPGSTDVAGIWGRQRFIDEVTRFLSENPKGEYILARWDIDHFKLFNDNYGVAEGDRLLRAIGRRYMLASKDDIQAPIFYAHWGADHFVALYDKQGFNPDTICSYTLVQLNSCFDDFDFSISYGFFEVDDTSLSVSVMCDRAGLALSSIKNRYDKHYEWYTGEMRDKIVEELEITSSMKRALEMGEFVPYFQPQYNYETGELIGAESLVRWNDPHKGIVSPSLFIPLFEKNGFISEVDRYMWDCTCGYIRKWLDKGYSVPPLSVNISRMDFYDSSLPDTILNIVKKHNLEPERLHLEMTESAYMDNPEQILATVAKLKEYGFEIEMDDFGSGYSSLNTLKDVLVDLLKLDMKFVAESTNNSRGGSILSSVIHMAHGINLPVLAEGIETREQADYLKTINCVYMQGYLFSKPLPAAEFEKLISERGKSDETKAAFTKPIENSVDFLDASTQSTLLFNSFLGGAAIIEYENDNVIVLRSNDNFYNELRTSRKEFELTHNAFLQYIETKSRKSLLNTIRLAIESGEETSCAIHFTHAFDKHNEEWIQARFRHLAGRFNSHILYVSITNTTAETLLDRALKKERIALENILHFAPGGLAEFVVNGNDLTRIYTSETAQDILSFTGDYEAPFLEQLKQIHPEDRPQVHQKILENIQQKAPFSIEFRIQLPQGGVRWVNLSANPAIIDEKLHYFGIYSDISKHKAFEIAKITNRDSNSLAEATLESLNTSAFHKYLSTTTDYVYIKDTNSTIIGISESLSRQTGHNSYADIIGKTDHDLYANKDFAAQNTLYDLEILESGEDRVNKIVSYSRPDSDQPTLVRNDKYALHDVQGNTIGLISIGSNITAEHNIAEYRLSLASSGRNLYRYNVKTRAFYDLEKGTDRVSPILIANGPETAIEDGKVAVGSVEKWRNLFRMIDDGIRTGTADIEFREDDGSYTWYRVSFKSILDQDGKPSSAIISYLNVQEHHMSDLDKDIANACVLSSITALYPNFSVSNLTTNVVKPLAFQSTETPGPHRTAEYDATIEALASACVGAHAAAFRDAFSRESLIKAFAAGKHLISSVVNMKYPDGSIHAIECIAIHIKDTPLKDDIISAGLLREL